MRPFMAATRQLITAGMAGMVRDITVTAIDAHTVRLTLTMVAPVIIIIAVGIIGGIVIGKPRAAAKATR